MERIFIPIDGNETPIDDPYKIVTWQSPKYSELSDIEKKKSQKGIRRARNVQPSQEKSVPLEEKIFKGYFIKKGKPFKKVVKPKCNLYDKHEECVKMRRTTQELNRHVDAREDLLRDREKASQVLHKVPLKEFKPKVNVVRLDSPIFTGEIKPKAASPSPSFEVAYVPSRKLLDLKRPKSGIFINEKKDSSSLAVLYDGRSPRSLETELHSKYSKFTIVSRSDRLYAKVDDGKDNLRKCEEGHSFFDQPEYFPKCPLCMKLQREPYEITSDIKAGFAATTIFGSKCIKREGNESRSPKEIASLYIAYCYKYVVPEVGWVSNDIDDILELSMDLHEASLEYDYTDDTFEFGIIPFTTIDDVNMTVSLAPFKKSSILCSPDQNVLKVLSEFFKLYGACGACIFHCKDVYLLIWRKCNSYFIFDPNGREPDCRRGEQSESKAVLIYVKDINHLVHIIVNLSGLEEADPYDLYDIRLAKFGGKDEKLKLTKKPKPHRNYQIVNRYYAIIRGSIGIASPDYTNLDPSLLIAYVALIYAKIDSGRNWTKPILDQLLKYTFKFFVKYTVENKIKELLPQLLPAQFRLGSYTSTSEIQSYQFTGHVYECDCFDKSSLTSAVKLFFSKNKAGLLQIDQTSIALWHDHLLYYVFDPFKRSPNGSFMDDDDEGSACLQLHSNLDSLCRMIYRIAVQVKAEGNFFIHPVIIKKLENFAANLQIMRMNEFHPLKIEYPASCDRYNKDRTNSDALASPGRPSDVPPECLSVLSVSPCQRTCSETEVYEAEKKRKRIEKKLKSMGGVTESLTSLSPSLRLPEFESYEIAHHVLESVVDCIISKYLTLSEKRTAEDKSIKTARRILLKSDRNRLENLKKKLRKGDNLEKPSHLSESKEERVPITLEEELHTPTNFSPMPDGNWLIFGDISLPSSGGGALIVGAISALAAIVLSKKYSIATWSKDLVDYSIRAAERLQESLQLGEWEAVVQMLLNNYFPMLQFGSRTFKVSNRSLGRGPLSTLESMLKSSLRIKDRLIVITNTLSCALFKREHFYYMFVGHACNIIGFRELDKERSGKPCLHRFTDLHDIVRRIDFDRGVPNSDQMAIIFGVDVENVTSSKVIHFMERSASEEDQIYQRELAAKEKKERALSEKLELLDEKFRDERKRVGDFRSIKENTEEDEADAVSELGASSDEDIGLKHLPKGEKREYLEPESLTLARERTDIGYKLMEDDLLFKIQGTTSLEDRLPSDNKTVRQCYFTSLYALLFSLHNPIYKWDFRSVDRCIENGRELADGSPNKRMTCSRYINNLSLLDVTLNVKVKVFETKAVKRGTPLKIAISEVIKTKRYFMIQITNASFAVYKDRHFHLFDSYPTLDLVKDVKREGQREANSPLSVKTVKDKNTASWILLDGIEQMLEYIEPRAVSEKWETEFKIYAVEILAVKGVPMKSRILFSLSKPVYGRKESRNIKDDELVLAPEEVKWLDIESCHLPWSRLNATNALKQQRGTALAKWKEYDVEIPERLYSLWGGLHPLAPIFKDFRGKQYLAVNVMACCMMDLYPVEEWNSSIIDSITVNGDKYLRESVSDIKKENYEVSLEILNVSYSMRQFTFDIHLESVAYGLLYNTNKQELNLSQGLLFFFKYFRRGILLCFGRSFAIGRTKNGYFMFDCESYGQPLFPDKQGAAYVLYCTSLQTLLHCIIMTLNIKFYNIEYVLYKVDVNVRSN